MLGTMRAHLLATILLSLASIAHSYGDDEVTRVFVFAGQSNMVGSDSRVSDIERFPPFSGLGYPQEGVRFSYVLGLSLIHISEPTRRYAISYAVFCLKKKK